MGRQGFGANFDRDECSECQCQLSSACEASASCQADFLPPQFRENGAQSEDFFVNQFHFKEEPEEDYASQVAAQRGNVADAPKPTSVARNDLRRVRSATDGAARVSMASKPIEFPSRTRRSASRCPRRISSSTVPLLLRNAWTPIVRLPRTTGIPASGERRAASCHRRDSVATLRYFDSFRLAFTCRSKYSSRAPSAQSRKAPRIIRIEHFGFLVEEKRTIIERLSEER